MRSLLWAHLRHPIWHLLAFGLAGGFAVVILVLGATTGEEVMVPLIVACFAFCALMPLVSLQGARRVRRSEFENVRRGVTPDRLFAAWALASGLSALVAALEMVFWGYYMAGFALTTRRALELGLWNEVGYVSLFLLLWASGLLVWIGLAALALRPGVVGWLALTGALVTAGAGSTYVVTAFAYPMLWFIGAGISLLGLVGLAAACQTLLTRGGADAVTRRWLAPPQNPARPWA